MTQTLFLHIGLHKTGSTAIQNFCNMNRLILQEQNFCYPESGQIWGGHHPYAWSLGVKHPHYREEMGSSVEIAGKYLEEADGRHIVLSSEDFEFIGPLEMKIVIREFDGLDIRVVAYLRPQDSYLESEYAQHVRMDESRYSGDIRDFYMKFDFMQRYNYLQLLKPWEEVFRRENIVVRPFQQGQFSGQDLFRDFCEVLGISRYEDFSHPKREDANVSLSARALRVLRELNKLELETVDRATIIEILARYETGGESAILDEEARAVFKNVFNLTNRRVAKRYLGIDKLFRDE